MIELRSTSERGARTAAPQQQRCTATDNRGEQKPDEHRRPSARGRRDRRLNGRRGESRRRQGGRRFCRRQGDRLSRGRRRRDRGARLWSRSNLLTSRWRPGPRLRCARRTRLGRSRRDRATSRRRGGSCRGRRCRRLLGRAGDRPGKAEILELARPDGVGRRRIGRRRVGALGERGRLAERKPRSHHYQTQAQTRPHRLPLMP